MFCSAARRNSWSHMAIIGSISGQMGTSTRWILAITMHVSNIKVMDIATAKLTGGVNSLVAVADVCGLDQAEVRGNDSALSWGS